MRLRRFLVSLLLLLAVAAAMRLVWLRSDPPVEGGVGIVWHDEGAWVHNARNRALWGTWRTDNWNPVFVAPVFTALEFAVFDTLGVGTWQARIVPAVSGLAAVALLVAGLAQIGGRKVALIGGAWLGANYAFVMWNRAALMESTMTACLVAAWAACALGERRPVWGLVAGAAAAAAWFTKASAAFFVAALALEALLQLTRGAWGHADADTVRRHRMLGLAVLGGLALSFTIVGVLFVLPNWTEYRFYNWQMSVTRKPEYSLGALADRASWLPLVQGLFSRMWIELAVGTIGLLAIVARWRDTRPGERLLVLWVVIGVAELVVHDSGNERRYVMFIPALIGLAALFLGRVLEQGRPALATTWTRLAVIVLTPVAGYLVVGSAVRLLMQSDIEAGRLSLAVRVSAGAAVVLAGLVAARSTELAAWLGTPRMPRRAVPVLVAAALVAQVLQFASWTRHRAEYNYQAAVAVGRRLPPDALVQGKLANGLALESRIRPIFVGNGFGNYEDRLRRDDARYILTYDLPRIGFESSDGSGLIDGILEQYPRRRTIATFVVDETPLPDRAALIDKFPDDVPAHARD